MALFGSGPSAGDRQYCAEQDAMTLEREARRLEDSARRQPHSVMAPTWRLDAKDLRRWADKTRSA